MEKSKQVSKQSASFSTLQKDIESSNICKDLSTAKPNRVKGSSFQPPSSKNKNMEVLNSDKNKTSASILKKKKIISNPNSSFNQLINSPEERTLRRSLRKKSSDITQINLSTFVKQCTDGSINQKGISYNDAFSPNEHYSNKKLNVVKDSMQYGNQLSYRSNNKLKIEKISNEQDKSKTNVSMASKCKCQKIICFTQIIYGHFLFITLTLSLYFHYLIFFLIGSSF